MSAGVASLLRQAAAIRAAGGRFAGCLLVSARGSTPQPAGALMLVSEDGTAHGTVGGGCGEAEICRRAAELVRRGESGVIKLRFDQDHGWDDGMLCGGTIEIAVGDLPETAALDAIVDQIECREATTLELSVHTEEGPVVYRLRLPPRERLYIAGAGHVGRAVARHGLALDFDVTMFDDRGDLLEQFAPVGAHRVVGDPAVMLAAAPVDERTYAVIVTRGHRHDEQALGALLGRRAGYLGMIGSQRKVRMVFENLLALGASRAGLEAVCAPIGIDIGAVSVEEIALSIAAQLVQVRRASGTPLVERRAGTGEWSEAAG
jgi:xanthine dehydrogenase accessory factor